MNSPYFLDSLDYNKKPEQYGSESTECPTRRLRASAREEGGRLPVSIFRSSDSSDSGVHGKCTCCSPRGYCSRVSSGAECAMSVDERTGRSRPGMKGNTGGASMYGPNEVQSRARLELPKSGGTATRSLRNAKTSDIHAFLSELKMRPESQRKLLCKLLRSAAARAPRKVSLVPPADPHPTKKP
jgi:hypothetical protein